MSIERALITYRAKCTDMNIKHRLGLISEEEWIEWMMAEDSLWNIIQKQNGESSKTHQHP